jgi:choline kinase
MKVATRGSRLLAMSKDMPAGLVAGENVGLLRLTQHALRDAFAAADAALRDGAVREFIAFALNSICGTHSFACVDVKGLPWIEVDFPEDLERARRIVWPAIAGLEAPQHVGKGAAA